MNQNKEVEVQPQWAAELFEKLALLEYKVMLLKTDIRILEDSKYE